MARHDEPFVPFDDRPSLVPPDYDTSGGSTIVEVRPADLGIDADDVAALREAGGPDAPPAVPPEAAPPPPPPPAPVAAAGPAGPVVPAPQDIERIKTVRARCEKVLNDSLDEAARLGRKHVLLGLVAALIAAIAGSAGLADLFGTKWVGLIAMLSAVAGTFVTYLKYGEKRDNMAEASRAAISTIQSTLALRGANLNEENASILEAWAAYVEENYAYLSHTGDTKERPAKPLDAVRIQ